MTYKELCSLLRNPTLENLEKFGEFIKGEPPVSWLKRQISYKTQGNAEDCPGWATLPRHGFPTWVCLFDVFVDVRGITDDKCLNRVLDDLYGIADPKQTLLNRNYFDSLYQVFYLKRRTRHNPFLYDLIDGFSQPKPMSHSFDVVRIYNGQNCAFLNDKKAYDAAFFLFFIAYMEGNNKLLSNKDLSEVLKLAEVIPPGYAVFSGYSLIIDWILENLDMRSNTTNLLGNSLGLTFDAKWLISQRCLNEWPKLSDKTTSMFFSYLDSVIPRHLYTRAKVRMDNLIEAGVVSQFVQTRFGEYCSRKLINSVHEE